MYYITKYALTSGIFKTSDGKVKDGKLYLPRCTIPILPGHWFKSQKKADKRYSEMLEAKITRRFFDLKVLKGIAKKFKQEEK